MPIMGQAAIAAMAMSADLTPPPMPVAMTTVGAIVSNALGQATGAPLTTGDPTSPIVGDNNGNIGILGPGNDPAFFGRGGNDALFNMGGEGTFYGGSGDDLFYDMGGKSDYILGGPGADLTLYNASALPTPGSVLFGDFNAAEGDRIGIADANGNVALFNDLSILG